MSSLQRRRLFGVAAAAALLACIGGGLLAGMRAPDLTGTHIVVGYNDLGMHCMQSDFSQMMILPPFNTLHAQVIRRGTEPEIVEGGDATVTFELPTNTHSSDKCNFWTHAPALLGANVPPDMGVAGFGMSGVMAFQPGRKDYEATGIPVTPVDDDGRENPYPLALITAKNDRGTVIAQTQAVVPVSWEMSCNLCHNTPGESTATSILKSHDALHGTQLEQQQPVMCASCHSDNALGAPGTPGVSSLSAAMHNAHAPRMGHGEHGQQLLRMSPG
jgi:cytochrome c553